MRSYLRSLFWNLSVFLILIGSAAFAASTQVARAESYGYCPDCMIRNAGLTHQPGASQPGFQDLLQRQTAILQFQQSPVTQPMPQGQTFRANWAPGEALPGAFQSPWSLFPTSQSQYDPNFEVRATDRLPAFWNNDQSPWIQSGHGCPRYSAFFLTDPLIENDCYPGTK